MDQEVREIFSDGSTSYYYSSLFFPRDVREDVFKFYAYVRTADDFVDEEPQDPEGLEEFREETVENWESGESKDRIVNYFLEVARKHGFEKEWVEAFLESMAMDLEKSEYETMDETLEYVYGSAEVIGLMMVQILGLGEESHRHAKMLGRSMQYCNFIRDIDEDRDLGRRYMPEEEMEKHGLETLEEDKVEIESFRDFIRSQIDIYEEWQREAEKGLKYIPYRTRIPVILSSRLYRWTAEKIRESPEIVYEEQVRPSKLRIFIELVKSLRGRR
jgi:phytoene synthase